MEYTDGYTWPVLGGWLNKKNPPETVDFYGVLPELPIRIELMTFSLRVKR